MSRRLRLTRQAEHDLRDIVARSRRTFGDRQAETYGAKLEKTLLDMSAGRGPKLTTRDDLGAGFISCRAAGAGGRHLLFCRSRGDVLEVVRVLHEAMDFARHLPTSVRDETGPR